MLELGMSSRIQSNPKHVFDCFLEVVGPQGEVSYNLTFINDNINYILRLRNPGFCKASPLPTKIKRLID